MPLEIEPNPPEGVMFRFYRGNTLYDIFPLVMGTARLGIGPRGAVWYNDTY